MITGRQFAALLGGLLVLRHGLVLLGLESFVLRDFSTFGYPLATFLHDSFWAGEVPLWNPYSHCGLPHLAQWNTLVCYPPSLLYCLLPVSWSLNLFCLLHLYAGGMGMFLLVRRWTKRGEGPALAALAYVFSGVVTNSLMWPNNSAAFGILPWVVYAADRAGRDGGRWVGGAALVGALQMLSGAPEIILCTWVIVGAVRIADRWQLGWVGGIGELRRLTTVVALVAGLAAVQLLPFFELLTHSTRATEGGDAAWAAPWHVWANYLCPLFRATPTADGTIFLADQAWTHSHYAGIAVIVLALAAAGRWQDQRVLLLGGLTVVALLVSLGAKGWVYSWLKLVGPLEQMRYPIKLLIIPTAVLPMLAALALDKLLKDGEPRIPRSVRIGGICVVVGLGVVGFLIANGEVPADAKTMVWASWGRSAAAMLLLLGLILFQRRFVNRGRPEWWFFLLVTVLVADLWMHHPSLAPVVRRSVWNEPVADGVTDVMPTLADGRIAITPGAQFVQFFRTTSSLTDNLRIWRRTFLGDLNLVSRVARVEGFYSLKLPQTFAVQKQLYTGLATLRPAVADLLAVKRYLVDENGLTWRTYENSPPLVTVGQSPIFAPAEDVPRLLTAADFDPRKHVFLDPDAETELGVEAVGEARIANLRVAAHRVEFDVECETAALAVMAQAWYPAWRATIDGNRTRIHRADLAFQAVHVPAGTHHVVFRYVDPMFWTGLAISLGSLVLTMAALVRKKAVPSQERPDELQPGTD